MTEQEWLASFDTYKLLRHLRSKASDRMFRLYLCAASRRLTHLFFRTSSLEAVEVAERFVDGQATPEELHRADWSAEAATFGYEFDNSTWPHTDPYRMEVIPRLIEIGALPKSVLSGGEWQVEQPIRGQLQAAARAAEFCAAKSVKEAFQEDWLLKSISRVQLPDRWLIDCVFGNPFRPIAIDPGWITWRDATIVKLAQAAYDERDLPSGELDRVRLAVLADALEEAGCTTPDIVEHLRSPGPHVRGCWVVDRLLGKE